MKKRLLIFTVSALGILSALVVVGLILTYRDFEEMIPRENSKAFPAFAKKQLEANLEKTLEFSKANVAKAKAMLAKALDNIGEISFPEAIIHDI